MTTTSFPTGAVVEIPISRRFRNENGGTLCDVADSTAGIALARGVPKRPTFEANRRRARRTRVSARLLLSRPGVRVDRSISTSSALVGMDISTVRTDGEARSSQFVSDGAYTHIISGNARHFGKHAERRGRTIRWLRSARSYFSPRVDKSNFRFRRCTATGLRTGARNDPFGQQRGRTIRWLRSARSYFSLIFRFRRVREKRAREVDDRDIGRDGRKRERLSAFRQRDIFGANRRRRGEFFRRRRAPDSFAAFRRSASTYSGHIRAC
mmetsp:Transcript_29037/g.53138  ORF Transcript_29037/g.53138 Transcript_29037/m.53138 type:complete len:267 (-) Transcript_29037:1123-1923(-)